MLANIEIKTWIIDDVTSDLNGMYGSFNRLQTQLVFPYAPCTPALQWSLIFGKPTVIQNKSKNTIWAYSFVEIAR